ncbi:MAG: hypothetical protein GY828_03820 [Candidatus Gracilibacteria bacterium]|nr:hypothetical protein [Candidatus Gracilibacteria bacterium]
MFFKKKKESTSKKIDKLVTGIIIGGAVASMIGLSKTQKGKKISQKIKESSTNYSKKSLSLLGKSMVGILSIFNKKK